MKTILFSSTRQWNPGDEFILMGVRNLLDDLEYNAVLYNRHPFINRMMSQIDEKKAPSVFDNSYLHTEQSQQQIDYVIFSGTPGWLGPPLFNLFDLLDKRQLGFSMIGMGGTQYLDAHGIPQALTKSMGNAELLTGRDESAYRALKKYNGILEVCPAIFSAKTARCRESLSNIGIVYQGGDYMSSVESGLEKKLLAQYKRLIDTYNVKIICHNYPDFISAREVFENTDCLYSSYAEDYPEIFDQFDLVVGTRVHGSGLASSLGIPSITISHDDRSETVLLFNSHLVTQADLDANPDVIFEMIDAMDIEKESRALCEYKEEKRAVYKKLLAETSLYQ